MDRLQGASASGLDGLHRPTELPITGTGEPPVMVRDPRGRVDTVFTLQTADGRVTAVYAVRNPAKLRHVC